jgi:hypothetical protein
MPHRRWLGLVALGAIPLIAPAANGAANTRAAPFDDARLEIEYNATDGDAGLQIFADAEDEWKEFEIFKPNGRRILDIKAAGVLKGFGLSELFSESSEPPFTELPFAEFKRMFPAGTYRFAGETVDGKELSSSVRFSHAVLDAPQLITPTDGGTLPANAAVIRWAPVAGAVDYEVIVTREGDQRVVDATIDPSDTSLTVPPEFLDVGIEYKIEVHASHASGNRIFTEIGFTPT